MKKQLIFFFLISTNIFAQSQMPKIIIGEIDGYKTDLFINKQGQFLTKQKVFTNFKLDSDKWVVDSSNTNFYYSLDKEDYKYKYFFFEIFNFIKGEGVVTSQKILSKIDIINNNWQPLSYLEIKNENRLSLGCGHNDLLNNDIIHLFDLNEYTLIIQKENNSLENYLVSYLSEDCKYFLGSFKYRREGFLYFEMPSLSVIVTEKLISFISCGID